MLKDKLIVIIAGLTIGAIIAFGVFLYQNYFTQTPLPQKTQNIETPIPEKTIAPTAIATSNDDFLTISAPEVDFQTLDTTISITGKTKANRKIIVSGNNDEQITISSADGSFTVNVKLDEGANEITIFPLDNETLLKTRVVTKTAK